MVEQDTGKTKQKNGVSNLIKASIETNFMQRVKIRNFGMCIVLNQFHQTTHNLKKGVTYKESE